MSFFQCYRYRCERSEAGSPATGRERSWMSTRRSRAAERCVDSPTSRCRGRCWSGCCPPRHGPRPDQTSSPGASTSSIYLDLESLVLFEQRVSLTKRRHHEWLEFIERASDRRRVGVEVRGRQ